MSPPCSAIQGQNRIINLGFASTSASLHEEYTEKGTTTKNTRDEVTLPQLFFVELEKTVALFTGFRKKKDMLY